MTENYGEIDIMGLTGCKLGDFLISLPRKLHSNLGASVLLAFVSVPGMALDVGLSIAYNNPIGANIGGNLIFAGKSLALEIGIGSVGGESTDTQKSASLGGDIDLKYFFADKWTPYIEAGLGLGIGAGVGSGGGLGLSAAGPFGGLGLMFRGSKIFGYGACDYGFDAKKFYPVVGFGVKF